MTIDDQDVLIENDQNDSTIEDIIIDKEHMIEPIRLAEKLDEMRRVRRDAIEAYLAMKSDITEEAKKRRLKEAKQQKVIKDKEMKEALLMQHTETSATERMAVDTKMTEVSTIEDSAKEVPLIKSPVRAQSLYPIQTRFVPLPATLHRLINSPTTKSPRKSSLAQPIILTSPVLQITPSTAQTEIHNEASDVQDKLSPIIASPSTPVDPVLIQSHKVISESAIVANVNVSEQLVAPLQATEQINDDELGQLKITSIKSEETREELIHSVNTPPLPQLHIDANTITVTHIEPDAVLERKRSMSSQSPVTLLKRVKTESEDGMLVDQTQDTAQVMHAAVVRNPSIETAMDEN